MCDICSKPATQFCDRCLAIGCASHDLRHFCKKDEFQPVHLNTPMKCGGLNCTQPQPQTQTSLVGFCATCHELLCISCLFQQW